jgi:hypothetical protein
MKPIGTPEQPHYAAAQRCIARQRYALDIGGIRTRQEREIVGNVLAARTKPRMTLETYRALSWAHETGASFPEFERVTK